MRLLFKKFWWLAGWIPATVQRHVMKRFNAVSAPRSVLRGATARHAAIAVYNADAVQQRAACNERPMECGGSTPLWIRRACFYDSNADCCPRMAEPPHGWGKRPESNRNPWVGSAIRGYSPGFMARPQVCPRYPKRRPAGALPIAGAVQQRAACNGRPMECGGSTPLWIRRACHSEVVPFPKPAIPHNTPHGGAVTKPGRSANHRRLATPARPHGCPRYPKRRPAGALHNAGAIKQRPGARTSVRRDVHPQPAVADFPESRDTAPASVTNPPIQILVSELVNPRFCGLKSALRPWTAVGRRWWPVRLGPEPLIWSFFREAPEGKSAQDKEIDQRLGIASPHPGSESASANHRRIVTPAHLPVWPRYPKRRAWHGDVVSFYEPDNGAPACSRLKPLSVNNTTLVEIQSYGTTPANKPATGRRSGSWPQFASNRWRLSLPMNRMPIVAHGWQSRPTDGERDRNQIGIRGSALPSVGILRGSWPVSRSAHGIQSAVQPAHSITLALSTNAPARGLQSAEMSTRSRRFRAFPTHRNSTVFYV